MKGTLRPRLEALESKALLSTLAGTFVSAGQHERHLHAVGAIVGTRAPHATTLTMTLGTNQSVYKVGQTVVMTLTITNSSNRPQTIFVGPSIDGFIITQSGKVVWRSDRRPAPQYIARLTLQPGQSHTISADWKATATGMFVVHNTMIPNGPTAHFQVTRS
jgi:intracellular proteinase inhibitor BsuPI